MGFWNIIKILLVLFFKEFSKLLFQKNFKNKIVNHKIIPNQYYLIIFESSIYVPITGRVKKNSNIKCDSA